MSLPGRALGIDYGAKRIGIAVSDALGIAATAVEVVEAPDQKRAIERIAAIAKEKDAKKLAGKLQDAIEKRFKFRPAVIVRSVGELREAIAATPFEAGRNLHPGKILVTFLADNPPAEAAATLASWKSFPEEIHLIGRELYIYFPDGAGKSKLPWSRVEKLLKVNGTARNWNSVLAMLEIAEEVGRTSGR